MSKQLAHVDQRAYLGTAPIPMSPELEIPVQVLCGKYLSICRFETINLLNTSHSFEGV